jgi:TonB family protein
VVVTSSSPTAVGPLPRRSETNTPAVPKRPVRIQAIASYPSPELRPKTPLVAAVPSGTDTVPPRTNAEVTTAPVLLRSVSPIFPANARLGKLRGHVVLKFTISTAGHVTQLSLLEGDAKLGEAAKSAVRQWKYRPALTSGEPIETPATVTFDFNLSSAE